MLLSQRTSKPESNSLKNQLQGTEITKTDCIKYLGLQIDSDMYVRKKSLAAKGSIRRSSGYLPVQAAPAKFLSACLFSFT